MSKITDNITDIRNIETVTAPVQSQLDNLKNGVMLTNTNLNTILLGGRYGVIGTGNTNTAKAGEHSLDVLTDGTRTMQIATFTDSSLHTRYYNGTSWSSWLAASSGSGEGSSTFTGLNDVPDSYVGNEGKIVRVKSDGTGVEFFAINEGITNLTFTNASESDVVNLVPLTNLAYKVTLEITNVSGTCTLHYIDSSPTTENFTVPINKLYYEAEFLYNVKITGTCDIKITIFYKI